MNGDSRLAVSQLLRLRNFGRTSLKDFLYAIEAFLYTCIQSGGPRSQSPDAWKRHLLDMQGVLTAIRCNRRPNLGSIAWPAGLDRSILDGLRLRLRTRNCLVTAGLMKGDNALTVNELLRLKNFGQESLRDLLTATEAFLNACIRTGRPHPQPTDESSDRTPAIRSLPIIPSGRSLAQDTRWESVGKILSPLLATAAEMNKAKTLADVLSPDFMRLACQMRISDSIGAIRIQHLIGDSSGLVSATLRNLSDTLDAASETERTIIERRLLGTPRATLSEIASTVGLTRERIRQLELKIKRNVQYAIGENLQIIAPVLREQFGSLVEQVTVDRRIEELLPAEQNLATRLLQQALADGMGFTPIDGMCLDTQALQQLKEIRASIRKCTDDVGLVDEQRLNSSLPSEEWRRVWPWVHKHLGICDLHGSLGIRNSGKARVKAAVISIGRPATCDEIDRLCGFGELKTRSHLSVIPSVVRADKDRWGLKEWIDDEYDGIVGEIVQRIEEDGGATTAERVLTELPAKFGVRPSSVKAFMNTPKFAIQDGWISLASPSSVKLRDLDDVIDGRDHSGAPFWTFAVEPRYFRGHSVTKVPPEFARALGCTPDSAQHVQIENLPECGDLSIQWQLTSLSGASIGCLAEPLQRLGLQPGQSARMTIKGEALVNLGADDSSAKGSRMREADAILERMMQRRKVL